ncbi:uncharacterized protein LOC134208793 [Armigeres subalbatus]|uniref:uncharacterized protein LOC134208793 n=1 Tax=Armigeres subalbatus TaxID=124917 RepID=UPI002ED3552F
MLAFIKNFLTRRTFQVLIGGTASNEYPEETGVPQGSVLAVTLFLIAMDGVFNFLPANVYVFVYADDILLVVVGSTPGRTRIRSQAAVTTILRWASSVGFVLNARKCVRGHVCSGRHQLAGPSIKLGTEAIPNRKIVRVLGVDIDRKLSFLPHFRAVKEACKPRVNLIKTLSKKHRTNNRSTRLNVGQAIIDSRLLYGLELTCPCYRNLISTLAPVFNNYVRTASGLLPSTPAEAACVDAGILPFRHRIQMAICRKAASFAAATSGEVRIPLLVEADRILRSVAGTSLPPVARVHWHGAKGWLMPPVNIDRTIASRFKRGDNTEELRRSVLELISTRFWNSEIRYIDGSVSSRGVGFGVNGPNLTMSESLPRPCNIFSAEAVAVFIAATYPADKPIVVLTDSASVVSALQSETPKHPWIQGTLAGMIPGTTFAWIPGHCGIRGNTEADALASIGHEGPQYTCSVPLADVKKWTKSVVGQDWARIWNDNTGLFLRKIKGNTISWKDPATQKEQQVISRLRTGHTRVSHNFGGGALSGPVVISATPKIAWSTSSVGVPNMTTPEVYTAYRGVSGTHWRMMKLPWRPSSAS